MRKVLITGGAGFIGSHVAKALVERGELVTLLDDFNEVVYGAGLKEERVERMFTDSERPPVIRMSILDARALDAVFSSGQFEVVFHLAAHANPAKSVEAAGEYTRVNVEGTMNVAQSAAKHEVGKLVFAGSSSVYNDKQTPFQEDAYPLKPRSPYGASKAAAEVVLSAWHDLYGLPVTVLRLFSVYGPWGRPDMAPMIFAERIIRGRPLELTQGRRQRDFTYIDDVVTAMLSASVMNDGFEVINVGRGEPRDLRELISALEQASGQKARLIDRQAPPGEMSVTYADITKARKLLSYEPKVSIDEGATKLIAWMRERSIPRVKSV